MILDFFTSRTGRIILSIIWGLGLAALFRKVCKGRGCIVIKGPHPSKIRGKIFEFNKKCYRYTPYSTTCQKEGNIPI